jgi:tetratricopeptide (TPR) repeat protein
MKKTRIASLVVAASLSVITVNAQTAAEQMQKGIYTQETAGDLDGAIAIYRQIVNSGNSPRDIAAQAQYRLAQSLLQKGDLSNAAQEFEKLARSYADYGKLVSSLATMARGSTAAAITFPGGRGGRGGAPIADANLTPEQQADQLKALEALSRAERALVEAKTAATADANLTPEQQADRAKKLQAAMVDLARLAELQRAGAFPAGAGGRGAGGVLAGLSSMSFDPASPVTVKGTAFKVEWINPLVAISVESQDGTGKRYTFATASPNQLVQQGATRASVKLGDEVTITGLLATGGQTMPDGTIAASATTVTRADGRKVFDRSAVQQ